MATLVTEERLTLLLVSDDPMCLEPLEATLSELGERLVIARSATEALEELEASDVALVLLDARAQQPGGREMAEAIRAQPGTGQVPILFLASQAPEEFPAGDLGAVDWVTRPVPPALLRAKVRAYCDLARQTARARRLEAALREQAALQAGFHKDVKAFARAIAQDLRAPLKHITGLGRALREDCGPALASSGEQYLARIETAVGRAGYLVSDLLTLACVTAREVRRVQVDLAWMARDFLADRRRLDPGRRVEAVLPDALPAEADPVLARLLMDNLIENAWTHTAGRATARIELAGGGSDSLPAVYRVQDDGCGFDPGLSGQLFEPFRGRDPATGLQGLGVGLAVARRIVERHGGRIWAEGAPDRGAAFYFTLG